MVVPQEIGDHKDTIDILLDKICSMREELLTIGRALDHMQLEANESRQQKYRLRAISR